MARRHRRHKTDHVASRMPEAPRPSPPTSLQVLQEANVNNMDLREGTGNTMKASGGFLPPSSPQQQLSNATLMHDWHPSIRGVGHGLVPSKVMYSVGSWTGTF
eukprot:362561-Chlamydomonas_euryale.AAC.2